ncbi:MAG: hypothetical protein KBC62_03930 [Candidatus Pacebacteria bacterium]|nr:hypothetical protein [Candidatus Paceibacterota bacterium]MBP9843127.1 hypothetical protein [Candidatus Paceibacterota bacterium]
MRFLALLLCFSFVTPLLVRAQISANTLLETNLSITSQPEYPAPRETTHLSLNDYGGAVYGASIEWYLNDKIIPGGTNKRSLDITVGDVGEVLVVEAILTRSDGSKATLSKTFDPLYVDVVVEPETHVPGFYTGRSLPSVGSTVYLTALLDNGAPMDKDLVYLWKVNQTVLENGPVRGRNRISFVMPQDSYSVVSLQVAKPDGTILAKRSTIVSATAPQIHFYEVNALYGTEVRSLNAFNMIGSGATLKAEPYYLDSQTFNNPNLLEWNIDKNKVGGDSNNPYNITLEKTGYPGKSTLDFHVRNTTALLQGARKSININI